MHEGIDEVFVHHTGFIIAVIAFFHLFFKAFLLVDWIVEFRKTIADFRTVDEAFKTIRDFWISKAALSKRRDFFRMTHDEGRLNEVLFNEFIKEGFQNLARAEGRLDFDVGISSQLAGRFNIADTRKVITAEFLNGFNHGHTRPRRSQVDFLALIGDFHGAQDALRRF